MSAAAAAPAPETEAAAAPAVAPVAPVGAEETSAAAGAAGATQTAAAPVGDAAAAPVGDAAAAPVGAPAVGPDGAPLAPVEIPPVLGPDGKPLPEQEQSELMKEVTANITHMNPLPQDMDKEAEKAAETINNMINPGKGIDIIVPKSIIDKAKAIAVLHIVKVAWGFSGRAGSGVIVAKLPDGTWSAPCAIGMAGAGWGAQVGVAVTDFMFIATTDAGVKAFSRGFNVQFGVNVAVALGPIGREGEVDIMLSDFAPVYTYSKTKGLFAGVSLEGSVLLQRSRANEAKYGKDVTGEMILTGKVPHPKGSESLYKALEEMDKRAAERAKAAAEKMKPTSEAPDF